MLSCQGELWREVEAFLPGSDLGSSVCVICWMEWKLIARMKLESGVAKLGWKMVESLDWSAVQTRLADSFIAW